jgi:glucose/arabinose dehydrogenase
VSLAANFATAMAWSPDGRLFWAERGGDIKVYQSGAVKTFASVATVTTEPGGGYSERGLLGLALSPSFTRDHLVYAFYSSADRVNQYVARWTDCAGTGSEPNLALLTFPAGGDCCHKGGRIAFGPDGKLYVTLGEEHQPSTAQDKSDVRGKILRYNADGSVPGDNPYGNGVWAYGLRNPFGIAFAPDGTLAVTSNGPSGDASTPCGSCGDLFITITRGAAYQWPYCWGYSHQITGPAKCGGQSEPDYSTERTGLFVAPTGMTWASAGQFANHFVFCAYSNHHMFESIARRNVVDTGVTGCELDVKQGPDGALYTSDGSSITRH